jgi:hypothetical protein
MSVDGVFDRQLVEVEFPANRIELFTRGFIETDPAEGVGLLTPAGGSFELKRPFDAAAFVIEGGVDKHNQKLVV